MSRIFLLLFGITAVLNSNAQQVTGCGFKVPAKLPYNSFASVYEARDIIVNMARTIEWQENFVIQERNGENNAYATIINGRRWIIYDNDFLERVDYYSRTKWASISILAHEMGHHYADHVLDNRGSTIPKELEADAFSGYMMAKLDATLEEAKAAITAVATDQASATHPAKKDRLNAIEKGWKYAKGLISPVDNNNGNNNTQGNNNQGNNNNNTQGNTQGNNQGNNNTQGNQNNQNNQNNNNNNNQQNQNNNDDAEWIHLSHGLTTKLTIGISDDGTNYENTVIEPGKDFVFRYEIYDYGWIRLRTRTGFKTFKLEHGKTYKIVRGKKAGSWELK